MNSDIRIESTHNGLIKIRLVVKQGAHESNTTTYSQWSASVELAETEARELIEAQGYRILSAEWVERSVWGVLKPVYLLDITKASL